MIWAALAAILTERLHDFFFSMPTGEASARRFIQAQVFMAPYTVMGLIRGLVPPFMRRAQQPYWTDGEIRSASERDPKCRKGFFERLLSVTFISHGWIHALIFSLILGAIGYSLHKSIMPYVWHQRTLHQTGCMKSSVLSYRRTLSCLHFCSADTHDSCMANPAVGECTTRLTCAIVSPVIT